MTPSHCTMVPFRLSQFAATLILGTLAVTSPPTADTAQARSTHSLARLAGTWRGNGRLLLSNGHSERIRCRAYYTVKARGSRLSLAIRCASSSYKFELRSHLRNVRGRLSGNWEERTFNADGNISGRATPGRISLRASGSISANLSISYGRSRQTVSLRSISAGGIRGLSISLRRR